MGRAGRPGEPWPGPSGMWCSHRKGPGVPPGFSPREEIHNRPPATRGLLPPPPAAEGQMVCSPSLGEKSSWDLNPAAYRPLSLTIVLVQDCPLPSLSQRLAARPPASVRRSRSRFSIKSQFLLSACHRARSLTTLPTEASGHKA
uniref:Uncharacterized protein n=1 Tax=Pipistrellus kuhlii TaxID=59472 RepID=A0A7J7Y945_PIPKU|nr:hypothetical protein mPipKuh1_010318 [Pipistrellus kuhlii]